MTEPSQFRFGSFLLDTASRTLFREGIPVPITSKVFETLVVLVRHRGQIVTKETLIAEIWPDTAVEESNLIQNIHTLRKIFQEKPGEHKFIVTIPGRGYSFVAPVSEHTAPRDRRPRTPGWERLWLATVAGLGVLAAVLAVRYSLPREPPLAW